MPSVYEIPLQTGIPQQLFISLGGTTYQLTLKYRNVDQGGWTLDIADSGGNAIVSGIPLVTGCDLLAPYKHLGFAGGLWVQTLSDPDAVPTFENLGSDGLLYWVSP